MKVCAKCKVEKDESEFSKHKGTKDGLQPYCKKCDNEAGTRSARLRREQMKAGIPVKVRIPKENKNKPYCVDEPSYIEQLGLKERVLELLALGLNYTEAASKLSSEANVEINRWHINGMLKNRNGVKQETVNTIEEIKHIEQVIELEPIIETNPILEMIVEFQANEVFTPIIEPIEEDEEVKLNIIQIPKVQDRVVWTVERGVTTEIKINNYILKVKDKNADISTLTEAAKKFLDLFEILHTKLDLDGEGEIEFKMINDIAGDSHFSTMNTQKLVSTYKKHVEEVLTESPLIEQIPTIKDIELIFKGEVDKYNDAIRTIDSRDIKKSLLRKMYACYKDDEFTYDEIKLNTIGFKGNAEYTIYQNFQYMERKNIIQKTDKGMYKFSSIVKDWFKN